MLKILSTDFDGTLHNDLVQPPVPMGLQELIRDLQVQGAKWIINTGRDLNSLMMVLKQAQLIVEPDYLVLVERELYRSNGNGYAGVEPWNQRCRQTHEALFERVLPLLPEIKAWILERFNATLFEDAYSPFCLVAATNADADLIMAHLGGVCRQVPGLDVMRNDVYARFCHADYNKGKALAEIGRLEGVDRSEIFAAGDHLNDLPMLSAQYAACLMAPANAVNEVKAAVKRQGGYLSRASHGQGVAEGLRFFLSQRAESKP
jgi:hypothetical protein